jgi:hypothetical protein
MSRVGELGLENDGRIVACEVLGGTRWVRCTHCRNHRGCGVRDNGENLADALYRMWGRDWQVGGGPRNLLLHVGITQGWVAPLGWWGIRLGQTANGPRYRRRAALTRVQDDA